jgi:hypothetical protein
MGLEIYHFNGEQSAPEGNVNPPPVTYDMQCYPNPVNGAATISFSLPAPLRADLAIYDLSGRMVTRLLQGEFNAGAHSLVWNADAVSAGIYLLKMEAVPVGLGGFSSIKKLVIVK